MAEKTFVVPASAYNTKVLIVADAQLPALKATLEAVNTVVVVQEPPQIVFKDPVLTAESLPSTKLHTFMNFDGLTPLQGFSWQEINKPAMTVITDPTLSTNKVLKVLVNSTSKDGTRIRNEATVQNLKTMNSKAAYGVGVYLHPGFKSDQNAMNFIQLHNVGGNEVPGIEGAIPNISFMIKGTQLDLNHAWALSKTATRHENDIHKYFDIANWFGRWVRIAFEVNWAADSTGYLRLYFDGKQVYTYNGPTAYAPDTIPPYFKLGLHYPGGVLPAGSTDQSQYALYDNLKITGPGGSIADVIV